MIKHQSLKSFPVNSKNTSFNVGRSENILLYETLLFSKYLVISPRLWNKWGEGIQQALITHANFDVLYRQMELETGEYAYKFAYTPWNLFEHI